LSELTYDNEQGHTVFTSQFLKNRGSCCKSACLHCPYGFTLKNHGLKFEAIAKDKLSLAKNIIDSNSKKESVSGSLLDQAFGSSKKEVTINKFNLDSFSFVKIKDVVCGVVKKGKLQLNELYLVDQFKEQGLTLDIVQSYFEQ